MEQYDKSTYIGYLKKQNGGIKVIPGHKDDKIISNRDRILSHLTSVLSGGVKLKEKNIVKYFKALEGKYIRDKINNPNNSSGGSNDLYKDAHKLIKLSLKKDLPLETTLNIFKGSGPELYNKLESKISDNKILRKDSYRSGGSFNSRESSFNSIGSNKNNYRYSEGGRRYSEGGYPEKGGAYSNECMNDLDGFLEDMDNIPSGIRMYFKSSNLGHCKPDDAEFRKKILSKYNFDTKTMNGGNENYRYSEGGRRYSEGGRRYSEGGRRYSEGGGRYSEGGGRYSEGGRRYSEGGRRYSDYNIRGGALDLLREDLNLNHQNLFDSELNKLRDEIALIRG